MFLCWSVLGCAAALASGGPPLLLPPVADFGALPNDRRASMAVGVTSTASSPIRIARATTSCGCLTARIEPAEIAPRGTASLLLDWDPRGKLGRNEKVVRIEGAAGDQKFECSLRVRGEVSFHGKAGTIFEGSCNACHGIPAAGKSGAVLYEAVCAVCHGLCREGVAPSPPLPREALSAIPERGLFDRIYDGDWEKGMPGFGLKAGGPLDASQVASLARLLRSAPEPVSGPAAPRLPHPAR